MVFQLGSCKVWKGAHETPSSLTDSASVRFTGLGKESLTAATHWQHTRYPTEKASTSAYRQRRGQVHGLGPVLLAGQGAREEGGARPGLRGQAVARLGLGPGAVELCMGQGGHGV